MIKATVKIPVRAPHLCSVLTGFTMLEKQGKIELKIFTDGQLPCGEIAEINIEGKRLAYDMSDGYNYKNFPAVKEYISGCDYYFKRSFSKELNGIYFSGCADKMQKWGFNYLVTCHGNQLYNRDAKRMAFDALNLLRGRKPISYFTFDKFECAPEYRERQKILFMTRLWSNANTSEKNLKKINSTRIEIVKAIRREYPNNSVAGLYDEKVAREICPELIMPDSYTRKDKYLEVMKNSDICIGSMGLHGSAGWKTGEYIAASRAIINERFKYEVTGDFESGKNYLEFNSADECMKKIEFLFNNPDEAYQIKKNNHEYYLKYLRPDVQVENSLKTAGIIL